MNQIQTFLWIIPAAPLLGAFVIGLLSAVSPKRGMFPPRKLVYIIACAGPLVSFAVSLGIFACLLQAPGDLVLKQKLFDWIAAGSFQVAASFGVDRLVAAMLLFITFVGFLIHVYSTGYMSKDPGYARYFAYLNLFLFSMIILVMGSNLPLMFVGWEGVGLCSYLLIGFWFEDEEKASAGKKAFITNRIGDLGFILGIFLIYWTMEAGGVCSLEFTDIQKYAHLLAPIATAASLLLFLGAVGKSAQIPLYVWLPDAMAGPTPVSALIHAATMVTAGVFMVARMSFLFVQAPAAQFVVAGVGAVTALYAASIAIAQNDIKKILAYSTISQLGYMFLGVGVGAFASGLFHVVTHAFFKACLFLCAGSVIHAMSGEQDIRRMGGLLKKLPVTGWTLIIAAVAICGLPPFSGFFSKDEILWSVFNSWGVYGKALWMIGFIGAGFTAFYMSRLVFLCLFGDCRASRTVHDHVHESPLSMTVPLMILAAGSAVVGFLGVPHALHGSNHFHAWLAPVFNQGEHAHAVSHASAIWEYGLMTLSVLMALAGIGLSYQRYYRRITLPTGKERGIYSVLANKYYVDEIYNTCLFKPIFLGAKQVLFKIVDGWIIEGIVNGLASVGRAMGCLASLLQTGSVSTYLFYILLGLAALAVWVVK